MDRRQKYIHDRRVSLDAPMEPAIVMIIRILAVVIGVGMIVAGVM